MRPVFYKYCLLFMIFVSVAYIVIYYNDGGDIHDAGVYFDSGWKVLRGQNPYDISRCGSFGPVPFALFLSIFPDLARAAVCRIMSLVGIYLFSRLIFPAQRALEHLAILLVLLWLSPVRELMVTNQMSGIAIGLLALGMELMNNSTFTKKDAWKLLLGATLFTMALDIKPHLCIFFLLSWAIYKRTLSKLTVVATIWITTHFVIDLSQKRIIELDWLSNLRNLNSRASADSLGDSLSFWPILNHYIDAPEAFFKISIACTLILTVICFYSAYDGRWQDAVILSFFIPSVYVYYHYYDTVPLCVVFVLILFRINNPFLVSFSTSVIIIPKEYNSIRNQLLVLMVIGFLMCWKIASRNISNLRMQLPLACAGYSASMVFHSINTNLHLSDHLLQSLIVTESLFIILHLYLYIKRKKISLG